MSRNGWEPIVDAGSEGAGIHVRGRRQPDGTWQLRIDTSSMMLVNGDMDDEWIGESRPVGSLAEAFEGSREWFGALLPMEPVHAAFRQEMLAIIEELQPRPDGFAHSVWIDFNRSRWMAACGVQGGR